MGGGILMKPAMDAFGDFNASVIGLLTCVTVLVMAILSVVRQSRNKAETDIKLLPSVMLSAGSAMGGIGGQTLFRLLTNNAEDGSVKAIQNIVLAVVVVLVLVYMLSTKVSSQSQSFITTARIKPLSIEHPAAYFLTGAALGVLSAFLGIGGGPMNVAALTFVFGMNMKTAVLNSLITIMAAQAAKLGTMSVTGFPAMDRQIGLILIIMAVTGAIGGLLGSFLQKRMSHKTVGIFFNCVQVVVLALCVYNIVIDSAF